MENIFKIISFALLGIGAFLVYGAKYIALRLAGSKNTSQIAGSRTGLANINLSENHETGTENENTELHCYEEVDMQPKPVVLNIKVAGLAFVIVGVILVLFVYR